MKSRPASATGLVRSSTLLILLFILLLPRTYFGQINYVSGKVLDATSSEPIPFAKVILKGSLYGAVTDVDGNFKIVCPHKMPDTLLVTYIDYTEGIVLLPQCGRSYEIKLKEEPKPCCYEPPVIVITDYLPDFRTLLVPDKLQSFSAMNVQDALNTEPGVKMDQRGIGGSRRISIRGSLLRSPFGTRNVRMYWDNMPLTSPDGSSPAEILDAESFGDLLISKGPSGHFYGPSTHGALIWKTAPHLDGQALSASFSGASYGMSRFVARYTDSFRKERGSSNTDIALMSQRTRGYRDLESNSKYFASLYTRLKLGTRLAAEPMFYFWQGNWYLPGSLTEAEVNENARQASAYSTAMNASVKKTEARGGLTLHWERQYHTYLRTTLYGVISDKENPYGTSPANQGYKFEKSPGAGIRSLFTTRLAKTSRHPIDVKAGGEYQWEKTDFTEYVNDSGKIGDLKLDQDNFSRQGFVFAHLSGRFMKKMRNGGKGDFMLLAAGGSLHHAGYRVTDRMLADSVNSTGQMNFNLQYQPEVSVKFLLKNASKITFKYARGFAPPTLWEAIQTNGRINSGLAAETANMIESELFWNLRDFHNKVIRKKPATEMNDEQHSPVSHLKLNSYGTLLNGLIYQQTDTAGGISYLNAGNTQQFGAEGSLYINIKKKTWNKGLEGMRTSCDIEFWVTGAFQDYRFSQDVPGKSGTSGHFLPGIPRWTASGGAIVKLFRNFTWNITGQFTGSQFLNDDNTVSANPYYIQNTRLTYHLDRVISRTSLSIEAGCNNIFNTQYTSFFQLNAFNGRYYNPAPGRWIFAGLKITYLSRG